MNSSPSAEGDAQISQPLASRRMHWAGHVARHALMRPDAVALRFRGESITWRELNERAARIASWLLARGVSPGDRIAVLLTNRPEFIEAVVAAGRLGAIAVPVNFRLSVGEVRFIVDDAAVAALLVEESLTSLVADLALPMLAVDRLPRLDQVAEVCPSRDVAEDAPAAIIYTSGTTGRPKGAVLSHLNLHAQGLALIRAWRLFDSYDESTLICLPMFHVGGFTIVSAYLLIGATVVIHPSGDFEACDVLDTLESEQVTSVFMVPTQWHAIVDVGVEGRNLAVRVLSWGGSSASTTLLKRLGNTFPGALVVALFGQTEMTPVAVLGGEDAVRKRGSIGRPIDTVAIRVVDDEMNDVPPGKTGEIVYRGPALMSGYWKRPDATAEAFAGGWFHSGDLVRVDPDGFLYVVDRKKDMIISGGENIYSAEVENALAAHPEIAEVAVIGRADERWGEVPVAIVVVPPDSGTSIDVRLLGDWLEGRLARYKRPRAVEIVDALPRTASGKVAKPVLRQRFGHAPSPQ